MSTIIPVPRSPACSSELRPLRKPKRFRCQKRRMLLVCCSVAPTTRMWRVPPPPPAVMREFYRGGSQEGRGWLGGRPRSLTPGKIFPQHYALHLRTLLIFPQSLKSFPPMGPPLSPHLRRFPALPSLIRREFRGVGGAPQPEKVARVVANINASAQTHVPAELAKFGIVRPSADPGVPPTSF